jgi:hypothetical protein
VDDKRNGQGVFYYASGSQQEKFYVNGVETGSPQEKSNVNGVETSGVVMSSTPCCMLM